MATRTEQYDTLRTRLKTQGKRIDVLRTRMPMPGSQANTGFGNQIAALTDRHRKTSADLVRLTSTPEWEKDWELLHERLERAIHESDQALDKLERESAEAKD